MGVPKGHRCTRRPTRIFRTGASNFWVRAGSDGVAISVANSSSKVTSLAAQSASTLLFDSWEQGRRPRYTGSSGSDSSNGGFFDIRFDVRCTLCFSLELLLDGDTRY